VANRKVRLLMAGSDKKGCKGREIRALNRLKVYRTRLMPNG